MASVVDTIKEFGHLSSCFVLLYLGHHLSFPIKKNLEAVVVILIKTMAVVANAIKEF
jgi:hypothetical protein